MESNRIAIAAIEPSKTNPRKHFDQAKLDELADSIKRHDVIQPILVRPNGAAGHYELVAGERRYRAAQAAGLADIPATVRELSDSEVLEIQVVENLQREDLAPLEEALGYDALLKCQPRGVDMLVGMPGGKWTVEEIAAKVGRSKAYVYAKLKLLALCPEARKAFYTGELDASRALLIARLAHHDTQRQALKDVAGGRPGDREPMSFRAAHEHILRTYMLKLSEAPFDTKDAQLLAKAGACGPCPKRTGNQADLFGDVKSADVCTDAKCFDDKRQAHYRTAVVRLEAQGYKVIAGDAAKKVFPNWEHRRPGSWLQLVGGFVEFGGTTYAAGRHQKVSALFPKDFKPSKLQHPLTGEIFDVVTQQAITAAAAKRAKDTPVRKASSSSSRTRGPDKRTLTAEDIYQRRLLRAISDKASHDIEADTLRWIVADLFDTLDVNDMDAVAEAYFPPPDDPVKAAKHDAHKLLQGDIEEMDKNELSRLVYTMMAARGLDGNPVWLGGKRVDVLKLAIKHVGVDVVKLKKAIADEAKAAATKKEAEKTKKKGLGRGMPKVVRVITPIIKVMRDEPAAKRAKVSPAKKRKPVASFMKPMTPDAALAAIVGDTPMPRTEVTSKLWGYIKKHDLQDKVNRRMINTDEKLAAIFGTKKQVSMFAMTKHVAKHLS